VADVKHTPDAAATNIATLPARLRSLREFLTPRPGLRSDVSAEADAHALLEEAAQALERLARQSIDKGREARNG
jgi:hypothetical protein